MILRNSVECEQEIVMIVVLKLSHVCCFDQKTTRNFTLITYIFSCKQSSFKKPNVKKIYLENIFPVDQAF